VRVRSFDHRAVAAVKKLEPGIQTALLIAHTAPVSPGELLRQAGAVLYCPDYHFVDEEVVRSSQADGGRVIPWTVNTAKDWARLLAWGVDGICTDFPDQLARYRAAR
jgi:glycerophosphoryl diester phosphodiesterase